MQLAEVTLRVTGTIRDITIKCIKEEGYSLVKKYFERILHKKKLPNWWCRKRLSCSEWKLEVCVEPLNASAQIHQCLHNTGYDITGWNHHIEWTYRTVLSELSMFNLISMCIQTHFLVTSGPLHTLTECLISAGADIRTITQVRKNCNLSLFNVIIIYLFCMTISNKPTIAMLTSFKIWSRSLLNVSTLMI